MYTRHSTNDGGYGGLGRMWFSGASANPEDYIPKKPKDITKKQLVWGSPALRWVEELAKLKDQKADQTSAQNVWWTATGPRYGQKVSGGSRAERVAKPKKDYKAAVKVVRDMPKLNLPPIEMPEGAQAGAEQAVAKLEAETAAGFGEAGSSKLPYIVLGLIILGILYNRHR